MTDPRVDALASSVEQAQAALAQLDDAQRDQDPGNFARLEASLGYGAVVVETALRLDRSNAYDAAYVVLAQTLDAELWTLDGPRSRNASGLGRAVRLVDRGLT